MTQRTDKYRAKPNNAGSSVAAKRNYRKVKPKQVNEQKVILLNKPFDVLCQFSRDGERRCLADFVSTPDVYPAGRLDRDSEGLVVLTNDGQLQARISSPKFKKTKTYWVQVEGVPDAAALAALEKGVALKDGVTLPATAKRIDEPEGLWDRTPPIRQRANQATAWIELTIREGKNRQVRRMTAAVGHPTLRLIRYSVGDWTIDGLKSGKSKTVSSS